MQLESSVNMNALQSILKWYGQGYDLEIGTDIKDPLLLGGLSVRINQCSAPPQRRDTE